MIGSNPFVGPRPLTRGEPFYGRDREVGELDNVLAAERIVLLHSPSGAGKSSLVQAGLLPRVRGLYDVWGPTRVNQTAPPESLANRYVWSAIQGFESGVPEILRRSTEELAGQSLTEYVAKRPRRRSSPESLLLIFDQFEEVLTTDPLAIAAKEEFFDQLGELLRNRQIWVLFALREDYLAPLDPYAQRIPTHLQNRFRLDFLGLDNAREAMVRPACRGGREFPAANVLLHDLATMKVQQPDGTFREETGRHVEPVQLQVVCFRLWNEMPPEAESIEPRHLEGFGDVTEALAGYYADSVTQLGQGDQAEERKIRDWFSERLITAGGVRRQVLRGAETSEGLSNQVIGKLLDTHLVRAEHRVGAIWYELAHDRLITPIRESNVAWSAAHLNEVQQRAQLWEREGRPSGLLLNDDDLAEAERWINDGAAITDVESRFLEQSRKAQAVQNRERRQNSFIRWLAVIATVIGLAALWQWRVAVRERGTAENQTRAAVAANLLEQGRAAEGNLLALEIRRPAETPTGLATLHQALASPVEARILDGHQGDVAVAAWSPDFSRILTASWDSTAKIWDAATGEIVAVLEGHTDEIRNAAWSPDGSRVATASYDGTVRTWDAVDGSIKGTLEGHESAVEDVAWSPDGESLASIAWDGTLRIWSAEGADAVAVLRPPLADPHEMLQVRWSPDGRYLLSNLTTGGEVWDTADASMTALQGHSDLVHAVAWSPDGQHLATASGDGTARARSLDDSSTHNVLQGHPDALISVAWSPDGERLVTTSNDGTARVWDATSGSALATLLGHTAAVWDAAWSPDGAWLATSSSDGTARLWRARDGAEITVMAGHGAQVRRVAWDAGQRLLTASSDSTARIWRPWQIGTETWTLWAHTSDVNLAAWHGDRILTASWDGTARITDLNGGPPMILSGHSDGLMEAAWSPSGRFVATTSADETSRVWDTGTGAEMAILRGHADSVVAAAWSPDERLATASYDGTARLWTVDGVLLRSLSHQDEVTAVAWSPDGRKLVTASRDDTAAIWDASSGTRLHSLAGHTDNVLGAWWRPNGEQVLTHASDGTARIWRVADGGQDVLLEGHTAPVTAAAWSPDSRSVLTASYDLTARIWDVESGRELLVLEGHLGELWRAVWSPDGQHVATAASNGELWIWDAASGVGKRLPGHHDWIWSLDWHANSKLLLSGSQDATARVWAVTDDDSNYLRGRIRARLRHCLPTGFYQEQHGLAAVDPRQRQAACNECLPTFFERLGDEATPWNAQVYEEAWQLFQDCQAR